MLIKAKNLRGRKLLSLDGEIGKVKEFYFDDFFWTIRYMIVDTGTWLSEKQVLISPFAVSEFLTERGDIEVNLKKQQIENSPSPDTHKPVSRQFESSLNSYYEFPTYWVGSYMWGAGPSIVHGIDESERVHHDMNSYDSHLRATNEVNRYHIHASDGEIGHVEDFLIDSETWTIRYLIVNTKNWLPGKKVLVSSEWIEKISWLDGEVYVKLSRDQIKKSSEYFEESSIEREYEETLFELYNRKPYWESQLVSRTIQ